jgi:predicted neuraminidase
MPRHALTSFIVGLLCLGLAMGCDQAHKASAADTLTSATVIDNVLIFPPQAKHVHSSSIVELPDGSLLAAWFHGSGEKDADDVRILGARTQGGTSEWGQPFVLADTPGHPDCNPVLWIDKDKRLWLFWSAILSNDWDSALVKYRISTDYSTNGPPEWEWQDNIHLRPANFSHHMLSGWRQLVATLSFVPRAVKAELSCMTFSEFLAKELHLLVIVLLLLGAPSALHVWRRSRTGRAGWKRFALRGAALYVALLMLGLSATFAYFMQQSSGKLHQRLGWLTANKPVQLDTGEIVLPLYSDRFLASIMAITADGGASWDASEPLVGFGNVQPSLVLTSSGQLTAWMRENGLRKRIRHSISSNNGRSWSPVVETELPNPGSKIALMALNDGKWIIAYNALVDGRHSLSLAISDDEGQSWRQLNQLEDASPKEAEFSYPCLIQTSDGRILVTYTCRSYRDGKKLKSIRQVTLRQQNQGPQARVADFGQPTWR